MGNIETVFGFNAGKAWRALNGSQALTTAQLAKKAKLSLPQVNQSLGWLAHEGKLDMETNGRARKFRLRE